MTTYDDIYEYFQGITKVGELDLPTTTDEQKALIHDGVEEYNTRMAKEIVCNDEIEQVSPELTEKEIRFISECMKLRVFQAMLEDFVSVWEVFQNDLGRRDYKSQVSAREYLIKRQEEVLSRLLYRVYDEYVGD